MEQQEMQRSLKPRHIMMITLGGTIGAGIFKGSSSSIGIAGPGVVVSYLIGGLILLVVMKSMADLAMKNPAANTLRELLQPLLGSFTGYAVGWIYWFNWVLVMTAEMTAAASFLRFWFPGVPLWVLALITSTVMILLNLLQVRIYGEMEYWLAGIKIVTLGLFIILGAVLIFTRHSHEAAQNLVAHGGFFPHGALGIFSSMLVVMFSFGGVEMIGMTLGETIDAQNTIVRSVRGVIFRVLLFYILPILVIVSLVPWNTLGLSQSPFVTVFQEIGIPYVGSIMNFVLLTAVLSAVNTGMYATSRMLYTQAVHGNAPKFLSRLSKGKVPVRALVTSALFLYAGVAFAFFAKGHAFSYLMVFPGYTVILVWSLLVIAGIRQSGLRLVSVTVLTLLGIIFVGIVATTALWGTMITVAVLVLVVGLYFFQSSRGDDLLNYSRARDGNGL